MFIVGLRIVLGFGDAGCSRKHWICISMCIFASDFYIVCFVLLCAQENCRDKVDVY
jgi:hypothetical protein